MEAVTGREREVVLSICSCCVDCAIISVAVAVTLLLKLCVERKPQYNTYTSLVIGWQTLAIQGLLGLYMTSLYAWL